jgi:pyruvate-ferredoxin/flavodoxin oxidoreductase
MGPGSLITRPAPADTSSTVQFQGITGTADGTTMIVYIETRATQGSAAFPITSSTQMGVGYQAAVANGFRNVWGEPLQWMEMES